MTESLMKMAQFAWIAPILMAWRQIQSTALRIVRLMIRNTTVDISIWGDVEIEVRKHYKMLPGEQLWAAVYLPSRRSSGDALIIANTGNDKMWFVGRFFVPFQLDRSSTTITYLVGTVAISKVWYRLAENRRKLASKKVQVLDQDIGPGFQIVDLTPKLARNKEAFSTRGDLKSVAPAPEGTPVSDDGGARSHVPAVAYLVKSSHGDEWTTVVPLAYDERSETYYDGKESPSYQAHGYDEYGYVHSEETEKVVADVRRWARDREWFSQRGIPWRRGCGLTGSPGTGKSLLAVSLARRFNMPLYILDLAALGNDELSAARNHLRQVPCFLLVEDIDGVFQGRTNVAEVGDMRPKLTFDALLQFFGGVQALNGVYTIVTTNHPESLDEALTRPGRIDNLFEIPKLNKERAEKIANNVLRDWPDAVQEAITTEFPVTSAAFVERCVRIAYGRWEQGEQA